MAPVGDYADVHSALALARAYGSAAAAGAGAGERRLTGLQLEVLLLLATPDGPQMTTADLVDALSGDRNRGTVGKALDALRRQGLIDHTQAGHRDQRRRKRQLTESGESVVYAVALNTTFALHDLWQELPKRHLPRRASAEDVLPAPPKTGASEPPAASVVPPEVIEAFNRASGDLVTRKMTPEELREYRPRFRR
jgi:DNA-binding PadR family transcriptional regulator